MDRLLVALAVLCALGQLAECARPDATIQDLKVAASKIAKSSNRKARNADYNALFRDMLQRSNLRAGQTAKKANRASRAVPSIKQQMRKAAQPVRKLDSFGTIRQRRKRAVSSVSPDMPFSLKSQYAKLRAKRHIKK